MVKILSFPWKLAINANTKIFLFLYTRYCFRVHLVGYVNGDFLLVIVSTLHLDEFEIKIVVAAPALKIG